MFASMKPWTEIRGEEKVKLRPGDQHHWPDDDGHQDQHGCHGEVGHCDSEDRRGEGDSTTTSSTSPECVVCPIIHLVEPVSRVWELPLENMEFFPSVAADTLNDTLL